MTDQPPEQFMSLDGCRYVAYADLLHHHAFTYHFRALLLLPLASHAHRVELYDNKYNVSLGAYPLAPSAYPSANHISKCIDDHNLTKAILLTTCTPALMPVPAASTDQPVHSNMEVVEVHISQLQGMIQPKLGS